MWYIFSFCYTICVSFCATNIYHNHRIIHVEGTSEGLQSPAQSRVSHQIWIWNQHWYMADIFLFLIVFSRIVYKWSVRWVHNQCLGHGTLHYTVSISKYNLYISIGECTEKIKQIRNRLFFSLEHFESQDYSASHVHDFPWSCVEMQKQCNLVANKMTERRQVIDENYKSLGTWNLLHFQLFPSILCLPPAQFKQFSGGKKK